MKGNLNLAWILGSIIWVVIIGGIAYILSKKEEDEEYLILKVIGFYLLGAFKIIFEFTPIYLLIPAGFLFYFFFMRKRERKNTRAKKMAAIFGVIMLYVGIAEGVIYEKIEYRNHIVITENNKFDYLNNDWKSIKMKLNLDHAIMNSFTLTLNKDNTIESLSYVFENGDKYYNVTYDKGKYRIDVNKIEVDNNGYAFNYTYEGSSINVDRFMLVLQNVDFEKYNEASNYIMEYNRSIGPDEYNDAKPEYLQLIDEYKYSTTKVSKYRNIDVYSAIYCIATEREMYVLDYGYQDSDELEEDLYDGLSIEVEDKLSNNKKLVTDSKYIAKISNILKSTNYTEVTGMNITLEPDLFITDNKGNKIGLCRNEGFMRRDLYGTSIWYIVSTDLYNNIVNELNLYLVQR